MSNNVVSAVRQLATAAKSKGHKLFGVVQAPSKWATEAGFPGSTASGMRAHIARQSGNGVGRTGRYPKVDAQGMLNLLNHGDAFAKADTDAGKGKAAKATASELAKARSATRKSATTAKEQVKAPAKPKAKAPVKA